MAHKKGPKDKNDPNRESKLQNVLIVCHKNPRAADRDTK
jgi:hypothetical protein